jgi:hypothetical protein
LRGATSANPNPAIGDQHALDPGCALFSGISPAPQKNVAGSDLTGELAKLGESLKWSFYAMKNPNKM